jgi:hypothetical protein
MSEAALSFFSYRLCRRPPSLILILALRLMSLLSLFLPTYEGARSPLFPSWRRMGWGPRDPKRDALVGSLPGAESLTTLACLALFRCLG